MAALTNGTIEWPLPAESDEREIIRQEKELEEEMAKAGQAARVGFLDPDFVLILFLASLIDIIDFIITVICVFVDLNTFTEILIVIFIDLPALLIVGGWIKWRTGKITASKRNLMERRKQAISKTKAVFQKHLTEQAVKSPKILARLGLTFILEILPILGALPFWTISVVSTLRDE